MNIEKNRHLIILKNLLSEESLTSDKLALLCFSSVRTIKSDLAYLKEELDKDGYVRIVATQSKGYRLEAVSEEGMKKFKNEIYRLYSLFYRVSIENTNRRYYILKRLQTSQYVLIDDLADYLHLSRNALADDLKKVGSFFESYHIKVDSVVGKGLTLKGSEWNLRLALVETYCSQYFEFTPLYPLQQFNDQFYTDKNEYQDVRHACLKIIRESKISLTDLATKKLATYLTLLKNGNRPQIEKGKILLDYYYQLASDLFDAILPEYKSENEVIALSSLLIIYSDFDLSSLRHSEVLPDYLLNYTKKTLDAIIEISQEKLYNPLFNTEQFQQLRDNFESILLGILTKKELDCFANQHLVEYSEINNSLFGPIEIQFTRILVKAIEEYLEIEIPLDCIQPITSLFHYLMEFIPYPYQKRSVAVISINSKAVGQAYHQSILHTYGKVIRHSEVFNQYEMRRINFADYDAVLVDQSLAGIYNNYPLPFIEYHSPPTPKTVQHLFNHLFIDGFNQEVLQWFNETSHFHLSTTMESYESFLQALIFRYGSDDNNCDIIEEKVKKENSIIEHYYKDSGISVIWFDEKDVNHEFIDFYIPKKFAINQNGDRIRGVIALSYKTTMAIDKIQIIDRMMNIIASDYHLLEEIGDRNPRIFEIIYQKACATIFESLH